MGRVLVIGDIHGGLRALVQVMEKARVSPDDTLVFLGDYVDGWSESASLIGYLIHLSGQQPCIFIKGNHDAWCEDWLRTGATDKTWITNGGKSTIDSYAPLNDTKKRIHLDFFERMKLYEIDTQNRLFIHAGFTAARGPQHELYPSSFSWDRTLWEMALAVDKPVKDGAMTAPVQFTIFNEIYIGHTPTLYYNETTPMQRCNVWNIDTGAAFTGRLSLLDTATKECWQSNPVRELYPGEKGRNR